MKTLLGLAAIALCAFMGREVLATQKEEGIVVHILPTMGPSISGWLLNDGGPLYPPGSAKVLSYVADPSNKSLKLVFFVGDELASTQVEVAISQEGEQSRPEAAAMVIRKSDIGRRNREFVPRAGRVRIMVPDPDALWTKSQPTTVQFSLHWDSDGAMDCVHGAFQITP